MVELEYAQERCDYNHRYKLFFNTIYIVVNVSTFVAQIFYIQINTAGSRYAIFVFCVILVIMDTLMSYKFYITVSRFV